MPLYDYFCPDCEDVRKDIFHKIQDMPKIICGTCGGKMQVDLSGHNKRDWFRPHWNENLDIKPVFVESKEHYKKLCKERGLTARCLM